MATTESYCIEHSSSHLSFVGFGPGKWRWDLLTCASLFGLLCSGLRSCSCRRGCSACDGLIALCSSVATSGAGLLRDCTHEKDGASLCFCCGCWEETTGSSGCC